MKKVFVILGILIIFSVSVAVYAESVSYDTTLPTFGGQKVKGSVDFG